MRLKNGAPCCPNAIVFTTSSTHGIRIGRTVSVMEKSSVDPKTSVLVKVFRERTGSSLSARENFEPARQNIPGSSGDIYSGLEVWKLSDVVFLDDSPSILGRVVAIDGTQVVVDCGYSDSTSDLAEGTSSSIKSSLKVFRLSDLETCIEGPDFLKQGSDICPPGGSSTSAALLTTVSHHVAGAVQHRPVCLVDPSPSSPLSSSSPFPFSGGRNFGSSVLDPIPESETGGQLLQGFRTLAVHATDSGPTLLLERVSDHAAFLVSSTHLTTSGVSGTSFVAVGNHDSKKKQSTVAEEAVCALESGLIPDKSLALSLGSLSNQFQTSSEGEGGVPGSTTAARSGRETERNRGGSRKGKGSSIAGKGSSRGKRPSRHVHFHHDKVAMDTDGVSTATGSNTAVPSSVAGCEFVALSADHPDLFFLRDCGGTIWPLLDGLGLRPSPPGGRNGTTGGPKRPVQGYWCVRLRQYAVQSEESVAVFVLGEPLISLRVCVCVCLWILYVRMYV